VDLYNTVMHTEELLSQVLKNTGSVTGDRRTPSSIDGLVLG
jgi:hypothetical protein